MAKKATIPKQDVVTDLSEAREKRAKMPAKNLLKKPHLTKLLIRKFRIKTKLQKKPASKKTAAQKKELRKFIQARIKVN